MKTHAVTDIGLVRHENQDACKILELPELNGLLAVVCDGMGGAAGGRIASELAIESFTDAMNGFLCAPDFSVDEIILHQYFSEAVYRANRDVFDRSVITPDLKGMGTTLSAALILGDRLFTVNIGDSRIYLLRDLKFTRLTHDDSYVQGLIDQGRLTEEDAHLHPRRNLLTRAVGTKPYTEFEFKSHTVVRGDRLLLTSDGLTSCVRDSEIAALLTVIKKTDGAAEALIAAAKSAGGPDNITVTVVDI